MVLLQQYVNRELPNVQAGFRKGRGTRDQIANIRWIMEKARGVNMQISVNYVLALAIWGRCLGKGFPHSSVGKESACNAGDPSPIPGWKRECFW